jgi:acrylyl-CoA reductase (NADPH)
MTPEHFRCYLVKKTGKDQIEAGIDTRPLFELPAGEVLVRVRFSSLNYKDALAATGHPGVAKSFPHVPGVDVLGEVVESTDNRFRSGETVLATGYELGSERWGGWAQFARIPADWVHHVPKGLTPAETMILGTAGFTSAQMVWSLKHHGVDPDTGEIVVTGATGGVGVLAVMLLKKLGYTVVAVSGKKDRYGWLTDLGAASVVPREEVFDESGRPLLAGRWAGAIDTVGGKTLETIIRSTRHRGCVTACGVAGGADLPLTVFPFILRGVTLDGIDSAWCPRNRRDEIWRLLGGDWKLDGLDDLKTLVPLREIEPHVKRILAGGAAGRVVVDVADGV